MHTFDHYTPTSITEALGLLLEHDGNAAVIAGGTDLLLKMKEGIYQPRVVINIKRLPDLQGVSYDKVKGLKLGALTTLHELARSPLVFKYYPVLARAATLMASEQIRNLATVGGNLCNAAPSADLGPPLIALDASALIVSASGERSVPLEEFFIGPGETVIQTGELLKEINLPPPQGETIYLKQSPRAYMDIAVVGVAVRLLMTDNKSQDTRIVLGAVAPVPMRALRSEIELGTEPISEGLISRAALIAAEECVPIDDVRGAGWYRRRVVEVLVRRGIKAIVQ